MNSWIPATNSTVSLGLPVSGKMKNNTPPVSAIAVTANKPRPCTKPGRPPRGPPSGSRPFIRRPMSDFTRPQALPVHGKRWARPPSAWLMRLQPQWASTMIKAAMPTNSRIRGHGGLDHRAGPLGLEPHEPRRWRPRPSLPVDRQCLGPREVGHRSPDEGPTPGGRPARWPARLRARPRLIGRDRDGAHRRRVVLHLSRDWQAQRYRRVRRRDP